MSEAGEVVGESTMGITKMAGTTVIGQEAALVDDGTMDEIVEKLKLLDYQTHFLKDAGGSKFGQSSNKPLNRVQFCLSDMTGQQSVRFASLAAWLVELCGARFAKFDQYQEDPNVTATNIVQALKELRLETKDIVPSKLVKGYGDSVLLTLNMLCDEALSRQRFTFEAPVYPVEPEQDQMEEDAGVDEETIADDVAMVEDSDDSDDGNEWNDPAAARKDEGHVEMIESQVSPEQWRLELEQVASKLKLSPQENMKDWRGHVEYISSMLKRLDGIFPEVRQSLANVNEDIQRAVEKIQKRESHFAVHFQDAIEKFRALHKDLKQLQGNYDDGQVLVQQQSARLNQLTEDLEHVKTEIQEREEQMTDSKPLINIKRALDDLKGEIKHMELRIGVLQHTVLHQTIAQNKQKNAGKGGAKEDANATFSDEMNQ